MDTSDELTRPADAPVVPARRAYVSPVRQQRAQETRERVVAAAAELFVELGWAGATVRKIAARAGVSVETVHGVGTKAFLLVEAHRTRYTGRGGWSALTEDPVWDHVTGTDDPELGLDRAVEFVVAAHGRAAELWVTVRATALTEPVVRDALADLMRLKRHTFVLTAEWMLRIGIVDAEVAEHQMAHFAAQIDLAMSAETYVQLTGDYGFTTQEYAAWLRRALPAIRP